MRNICNPAINGYANPLYLYSLIHSYPTPLVRDICRCIGVTTLVTPNFFTNNDTLRRLRFCSFFLDLTTVEQLAKFEQYLRNPSCAPPFKEFMGKLGLYLLQLTRSAEGSEMQHEIPLVLRLDELLQKLEILRPCLSSADCTGVESELKVLSGNLFRDTIKTMGRADVAPVARALTCADTCLKQQRYNNTLLLKRCPSLTKPDGDGASVKTEWVTGNRLKTP